MPIDSSPTPSLPAVGPTAARGRLEVFLGTAPAVGKSYAMLAEGGRLAAAGADVVVGYVEPHGHDNTTELVGGLAVVPPKVVTYRGATFRELDIDAVIARSPQVVLVDELAHTNVPGQRHAKRWQDVQDLLDAGIDVISNINVQHLDSLHDEVERLTGIAQRETLPDDVVAAAERLELVELEADALRERVRQRAASGTTAASALDLWFTTENLRSLHDLAVDWMARHARRAGATGSAEPAPRPCVVVSLDAGPTGDRLVRRAAQIAQSADAQLIGVHVCVPTGLATPTRGLENRRRLLAELDGRYAEIGALDRGDAVVQFARAQRASELVVGAPRRSRLQRRLHGAEIERLVVETGGELELHVTSVDDSAPMHARPSGRASKVQFSPRRRLLAWVLAVAGPTVVATSLTPWRASLGLAGALLALLLVTAATAAAGGLTPSLVATALAFALADYLYAAPLHSFRIGSFVDLVGLLAFAGVASIVTILVDRLARASLQAVHGRAESEGVARLAAATLAGAIAEHPELLDELRTVFGLDSVAMMTRSNTGWKVTHAAGKPVPAGPDEGSAAVAVGADAVLVLTGGGLPDRGSLLLGELVDEMGRLETRAQLDRVRTSAGDDPTHAAD
jgi:two-component system, OmpR family, sensor histidine kinase KdpD